MLTNQLQTVNVILITNNAVEKIVSFEDNPVGNEAAEKVFVDICAQNIHNWDAFTQQDIDAALENGYEEFGHGSVCICHSPG